jgi:lipoprotein
MTKKLIIIVVFLTVLTSGTLYSCSINNTKQAVVKNVKSVLQTKKDLQLAVIPSGDQEITINGKTHIIKNETFTAIKDYLNANNQLQQTLVDLIGSQVTDENIALLAYYSEKYSINPKDLLNNLTKQ